MARRHARLVCGDPEVQAYCRALMDRAAAVRLPELFSRPLPGALYRVPDRSGITTLGLRRSDLPDDPLVELLRYRMGQYLHPSISIIDPRLVCEARMEHEPLENESPGDIHFISGLAETGEVLCYAVLRALPGAPPGATLRDRERPFFPVEKVHGSGVFNRLALLPDLPVTHIFELGRYVKNHFLHPLNERNARAPSEIALAVFRTLGGPLRDEVLAFVGDLEEGIAKKTLDFFHIPTLLIRGVVPYSPEESYFFPRNQYCTVYPFASLTADLAGTRGRLDQIEAALETPGREGLKRLFELKESSLAPPSSLEPPGGLAQITTAELPEQGGEMAHRREMLETAEELEDFDPLSVLSDAERRLLSGFMQRREFAPGEAIVRQGEVGDALYLIDEGEAEVRIRKEDGGVVVVNTLGPDQYFGEIALVRGGVRTADVVATTPMSLLRLDQAAYSRFLARLAEVEQRLARTAESRASDTARKLGTATRGEAE